MVKWGGGEEEFLGETEGRSLEERSLDRSCFGEVCSLMDMGTPWKWTSGCDREEDVDMGTGMAEVWLFWCVIGRTLLGLYFSAVARIILIIPFMLPSRTSSKYEI